jgi:Leucine-rich repeat (LRR) protein
MLCKLKKLKTLKARQNKIRLVPDAIEGLTALEVRPPSEPTPSLALSHWLPPPGWQSLDLHDNQLVRVPEEIVACTALREVDLSLNGILELPADGMLTVERLLCFRY